MLMLDTLHLYFMGRSIVITQWFTVPGYQLLTLDISCHRLKYLRNFTCKNVAEIGVFHDFALSLKLCYVKSRRWPYVDLECPKLYGPHYKTVNRLLMHLCVSKHYHFFQIDNCCFFCTKSFSAPMLTCQIDLHEPTSVEFESGKHFLSRKPIRKCRQKNIGHFETGLNVLNIVVHHCNRVFMI